MRILVPSIVVCLALAAGGCADPVRAPLDVNWSFGGLDCDQVGVATIHLQMDRELLNPSDYSCLDSRGNVTTGAHLGSFLLGDYNLTVIGLDASGTEILRGTRTAHVARGTNLVEVDIGGSVTLRWTFGGGLTCAQAGVTVVNLSIDGSVITDAAGNPDIPCTQAGQDAAQISPLLPGAHSFDLVGLVRGVPSFVTQGVSFDVHDLLDTNAPVDLPRGFPTAANADVFFSFAGGLHCDEAQVDNVQVFVDPDANGHGGFDPFNGVISCVDPKTGIEDAKFPIAPGTHSFAILGFRGQVSTQQLVYATTQPPSALFEIGLHSEVGVDAASFGPAPRGGANLTWVFVNPPPGSFCSGGNWSLTDPSGAVFPQSDATCAGGRGGVSLVNLRPGLWTFDGTANVGGFLYRSTTLFSVPNGATNNFKITFTR
jgi:hypothetical protein